MCKSISVHREEIKDAVKAIANLDGYRAKAVLGKKLGGTIPEVGNSGIIRCVDAKHPVLILRGVQPIGNSIKLDDIATSLGEGSLFVSVFFSQLIRLICICFV